MKDIVPLLRSLGLLESEVKTYLAGFEHGAGTVLDYTKETKLSRQATYAAIESLTKRGLMTSVVHGKKRLYAAEHPDKLLAYAKRREADMKEKIGELERALPELALQMGGEKPMVRVYEGKEGLRAIIEDMRAHPSQNLVEMTDLAAMYKVLSPEDLAHMRTEMKKIHARVKGIYSGTAIQSPEDIDRFFLPKELGDFKSNIGIYGDKITFVTFEGKMHSVVIESRPLVKTLRILFQLALQGAKDLRKN